jgi:hypothetical protein
MLFASKALAGTGGRISGTVKDPSGAFVQSAQVVLTEVGSGARYTALSDSRGAYSFPVLPVGHYDLEIASPGFELYRLQAIVIDANSVLGLDSTLKLGKTTDTVTVQDEALHIETVSTQIGEVITGTQMSAVPLNGRSFTDLLPLQPGVSPLTSITDDTVQDVGAQSLSPAGFENPGTISINGQREFANAFFVNGSDSEEDVNSGIAILPNLDSIAEFRILTANFDAEYGEFSGGQINVVTKSGNNQFHGGAFEFLRNTALDANDYFSNLNNSPRGKFQQNQFGGTAGGPILHDKFFFFGDYQGTRQTVGVAEPVNGLPSATERAGAFGADALPGTVSGPYFASILSQELGQTVNAGEPYSQVFPSGTIPQGIWSAPAKALLQYIPTPGANGQYSTSAYNQTLNDNKGALRLDAQARAGALSAYYFIDAYSLDNPYPIAQGGSSAPGFNALNAGRAQLVSLGDTKLMGAHAVNEFHFSFLRDYNDLGKPKGGVGVSLASQGFVTGVGTLGIVPLSPGTEGVENVDFNGFSIGTNTNELKQANNTWQWLDNYSFVRGVHSFKAGGEFHYDQVNVNAVAQFNGNFIFTGSETGSDFADFLLGAPTQYNQSQLNPFYERNEYAGAYAQDSWRVAPSVTVNYGVRWDRISPWYEKYNQISTFEPGKQSVVFPGAPEGILYPTDPGVRRTIAPPGDEFSPRLGVAWVPQIADGFAGKLFGAGKTSIRAGAGLYYTAIEALTLGVLAANAPYGTTYTSPAPPLFTMPFVSAANGATTGQAFPETFAPLDSSRSHPDPNFEWSQYLPISGIPGYSVSNRIPYTEEYNVSVERQLGPDTVLNVTYVGAESHRQLVLVEANAGNPALCFSLSEQSEVAAGTVPCGPFLESNVFTTASGQVVNGTRGPLGPNFGSNTNQSTIGNANYNSLQSGLRHTSKRLTLFAAYTYSKTLDESSNLGEEVNPFNPALNYGLASFGLKHNFVGSYAYQLPFDQLLKPGRMTTGWEFSGIARLASGFPVTLVNYGDNSLIGAEPNGINNYGVDEPDLTGQPLNLQHDPRHSGLNYFNANAFTQNALGTPGDAKRRFFYGPGLANYDMALAKAVALKDSASLSFRLEAFNVFNHAQFFGPSSVDGNIGDQGSTFGNVVSAQSPRLLQLSARFSF